MKSIDTNPLLESIRSAYRRSAMYEKINAAPQEGRTDIPEREPNTEPPAAAAPPLGIAWDEFERELGERANP